MSNGQVCICVTGNIINLFGAMPSQYTKVMIVDKEWKNLAVYVEKFAATLALSVLMRGVSLMSPISLGWPRGLSSLMGSKKMSLNRQPGRAWTAGMWLCVRAIAERCPPVKITPITQNYVMWNKSRITVEINPLSKLSTFNYIPGNTSLWIQLRPQRRVGQEMSKGQNSSPCPLQASP